MGQKGIKVLRNNLKLKLLQLQEKYQFMTLDNNSHIKGMFSWPVCGTRCGERVNFTLKKASQLVNLFLQPIFCLYLLMILKYIIYYFYIILYIKKYGKKTSVCVCIPQFHFLCLSVADAPKIY